MGVACPAGPPARQCSPLGLTTGPRRLPARKWRGLLGEGLPTAALAACLGLWSQVSARETPLPQRGCLTPLGGTEELELLGEWAAG